MKKKLSFSQIQVLTGLVSAGELKLSRNKNTPTSTVKSLINMGIVDYNERFDGIVIAEKWKEEVVKLVNEIKIFNDAPPNNKTPHTPYHLPFTQKQKMKAT